MRFQRQRGQSLVELALVLPLLTVLLMGVVDLGQGVSTYIVLTHSAREGAYWLSTHPYDVDGTIARVQEEMTLGGIDTAPATITVTPAGSGGIGEVQIDYAYVLLFGLFSQGALNLRVEAFMEVF
ncbi:MAG: pilus assembly protein [Chloroflexi bacterium]|nr:pilus assembly protein [Chloroflexota bacterium]